MIPSQLQNGRPVRGWRALDGLGGILGKGCTAPRLEVFHGLQVGISAKNNGLL